MDFLEYDRTLHKKFIVITFIFFLHILTAYVLITSMPRKKMTGDPTPRIEVKMIGEVKSSPSPALLLPLTEITAAPFILPQEIQSLQQQDAIAALSDEESDNLVMPAPRSTGELPAIDQVNVPATADFSTCVKPEYPRQSLRNKEQGAVVLQLLIDTSGRAIDAKVDKSSGFVELDNAALAALSLCKFKPDLANDKAQQFWTSVQYVWKL